MRRALRAVWFSVALAIVFLLAFSAFAQRMSPRMERARALIAQGVAAYERGELELAVTKLREAQRNYRSPENAFNIARIYERMGRVEDATTWFNHYLNHGNPDAATRADIEARIAALHALEARQRDQIYAAPASTSELSAEAARFYERGVTFFQRGRFQQACQAFSSAAQFVNLPEINFNAAVSAERANDRELAREFYRRYLESAPNAPDRDQVEAKIRELRGH